MDEIILCGILLISLAIVFGIIGAVFSVRFAKRISKCTATATGWIVDYKYDKETAMRPIAEFSVEGQRYVCRKEFSGVKEKFVSIPGKESEERVWVDEKDCLHIVRGSTFHWRYWAEQLWPIGSAHDIYYDPGNPNNNFMEQPGTGDKTLSHIFAILCGITLSTGLILTVYGIMR